MNVFESIKYVTSGITLIAFIVATVAWAYRSWLKTRKQTIELAPSSERAALIERTLEWFTVDTSSLTGPQKFQLAMRQIDARAERFRISAKTSLYVTCLAGVITLVLLIKRVGAVSPSNVDNSSHPESNSSPPPQTKAPAQVPPPVPVLIRVSDETGQPLSNRYGTIVDDSSRIVLEVRTNTTGEIKATMPPGDYDLHVSGVSKLFPLRLVGPYQQQFDVQVPSVKPRLDRPPGRPGEANGLAMSDKVVEKPTDHANQGPASKPSVPPTQSAPRISTFQNDCATLDVVVVQGRYKTTGDAIAALRCNTVDPALEKRWYLDCLGDSPRGTDQQISKELISFLQNDQAGGQCLKLRNP